MKRKPQDRRAILVKCKKADPMRPERLGSTRIMEWISLHNHTTRTHTKKNPAALGELELRRRTEIGGRGDIKGWMTFRCSRRFVLRPTSNAWKRDALARAYLYATTLELHARIDRRLQPPAINNNNFCFRGGSLSGPFCSVWKVTFCTLAELCKVPRIDGGSAEFTQQTGKEGEAKNQHETVWKAHIFSAFFVMFVLSFNLA